MPVRVCVIGGGRWVCNFSKFSKIKKITKSDIVCQMSLLVAVSIFKVLKNPKILKITKMCCMAAARSSFLLIHHVTIHQLRIKIKGAVSVKKNDFKMNGPTSTAVLVGNSKKFSTKLTGFVKTSTGSVKSWPKENCCIVFSPLYLQGT